MTESWLHEVLNEVSLGRLSPEQALERLAAFPSEDLEFARVDHLRGVTQGHAEVVFCPGKTVEQIVEICGALDRQEGGFLATRADAEVRAALRGRFPGALVNDTARTVWKRAERAHDVLPGRVLVVCAGTSDLPAAEEAAVVAAALGAGTVETLYDVGVAGIHRLLARSGTLRDADVIIVVAGMDGALASVVGGMVRVPVIAVPTSVGYGTAFGGVAAMLAMLNSCAAGVTVVNIDNGFGAAVAATRILRGGEGRHRGGAAAQ